MLKQAAATLGADRVADAARVATRQVWLAGLGAAMVARDWARNDAGDVFRALVKEGSAVEARAVRGIGRRVDSSIVVATTVWNRARDAAQATVNSLAATTAAALPRFKSRGGSKRAIRSAAKKTRRTTRQVAVKGRKAKRSA